MRVEIHQGRVTREIIVSGINAKVGISDSGTGHVQGVNDFSKVRRRAIGRDVVSEYDEGLDEGKKSKTHCIFNQRNQQIT